MRKSGAWLISFRCGTISATSQALALSRAFNSEQVSAADGRGTLLVAKGAHLHAVDGPAL